MVLRGGVWQAGYENVSKDTRAHRGSREALVCVLIDEVGSLTAARKSSMNGIEAGAVDLAFVDRADIKQYIGPPSRRAIYYIYLSCLKELMREQITVKYPVKIQQVKLSQASMHNLLCYLS
ncbi:hypothetical protein RRG08_009045 [Elysia crispata]|uniref:Uncharacterized protein n=1 Tax=Elysia crispata TaxID=231223 RepID=A0AAE1E3B7_9GAST|nr:hypothetical protein RRG08_009045 [Elysia crispata]